MQLGDGRSAPIRAVHNFHVPTSEGMGGIPKPPSGSKPFTTPMSKYDPLPWSDFYDSMEMLDEKMPVYYAGNDGHVFLCLHGAGHSAMSFAALAVILKSAPYNSTCVSFDFRGHGGHYCDNEQDMQQQNLVDETIRVIKHIAVKMPHQSIIIVGHSLGGSIATKTMQYVLDNHADDDWSKHIKGLFVIDVAEGSAMDALPHMEAIVRSRPE